METTDYPTSIEAAKQIPQTLTIAHQQWASRPADERYQSLDALSEAVDKRQQMSREATVDMSDVSAAVFEDGIRVMLEGSAPSEPTNWAFGQLASAVDFRVSELRKLSAATAVAVINERIQARLSDGGQSSIKIMRQLGDNDDLLRAITSPTYGRIFDSEVIGMVRRVVDQSGGKFTNPLAYAHGKFGEEPVPSGLYMDDRSVFIFMIDGGSIFDAGPRAQINRGFIVSNSEVGARSLTIMRFAFNQVCGNHFIFGATDINMKRVIHNATGPSRAQDVFGDLLEFTSAPMDVSTFVVAQGIKLVDIRPGNHDFSKERANWIKAFALKYGFAQGEVRDAIAQAQLEEGDCSSVFHLMQGMTASARQIPNADTRTEYERRVGACMEKLTGKSLD